MDLKHMTFMHACNEFFGKKQGQSAVEFLKELKELTPEDRTTLVVDFRAVGIDATKATNA